MDISPSSDPETAAGSHCLLLLSADNKIEIPWASDEEAAAADAFLEYLQTDDAMKVFEEYGFAAYKADDKKEETAEDAKEDKTEETDTAEEAK